MLFEDYSFQLPKKKIKKKYNLKNKDYIKMIKELSKIHKDLYHIVNASYLPNGFFLKKEFTIHQGLKCWRQRDIDNCEAELLGTEYMSIPLRYRYHQMFLENLKNMPYNKALSNIYKKIVEDEKRRLKDKENNACGNTAGRNNQ